MSMTLEDIRAAAARLEGVAFRTPLLNNRYLDEAVAAQIYIKPENLQQIGAFKFRGAYNRLSQLSAAEMQRGVVAFSSGNHAQGVALAAALLGTTAVIVMPSDAPEVKIQRTRALGAEIRLYERHNESREAIAAAISADSGRVLVPAFDDEAIIAGQGTCGLEIAEQCAELHFKPDLFLCPVGGGGLMAGASTAIRSLLTRTAVWGVEPQAYNDHQLSLQHGSRQSVTPQSMSLCDALLASTPGEITWSINRHTVERYVTVSDEQVERAISFAFHYLKLVVEPGGAVGLAFVLANRGQLAGKNICLLLSGGNVDPRLFSRCLAHDPLDW